MVCFNVIATALLLSVVSASPAGTSTDDTPDQPTTLPKTLANNPTNQLDCPKANGYGFKYTSDTGSKWAIMCGFDTASTSYFDIYENLSFDDCIEKCQSRPACVIATYTGHCYLKKSTRNQPFIVNTRIDDRTAFNLERYNAVQNPDPSTSSTSTKTTSSTSTKSTSTKTTPTTTTKSSSTSTKPTTKSTSSSTYGRPPSDYYN